tara:strand:- start:7973 stop:9247 length:1275 start_codon:yes stop_codon:yes gene_type:complete
MNYKIDISGQLIKFSIILMPIFLITGPFIPDLIVTVSSVIFLIYCFKKDVFFQKNINNFFYFFISFYFLIVLSSLNSEFFLQTYKSSIFYFRFFIFAFFLSFLIDKHPKIKKYTFNVLIFCFGLIIIDGFLEFFTGINLSNTTSYPGRLRSFFDELIMGSYLTRLFPLFLALFFLFKDRINIKIKILSITLFILTFIIVFLSGERTAFYLLAIFLTYLIFFLKYNIRLKLFLIFFSLVCFLSIYLFFPKDFNQKNIMNRMVTSAFENFNFKIFKNFNTTENTIIFSEQHTILYKTSLKIFSDNKIIGAGPKSFRYVCLKEKYYLGNYSCSTHSHNLIFQLLSETGLIGFSFLVFVFLFCIIYVIYFSAVKNKLSNFQIILFGSILINFFPFSPSGSIFNNYMNIITYYPIGYLFWSFRKSKKLI